MHAPFICGTPQFSVVQVLSPVSQDTALDLVSLHSTCRCLHIHHLHIRTCLCLCRCLWVTGECPSLLLRNCCLRISVSVPWFRVHGLALAGQAASDLARHFRHVIALDASEAQVKKAPSIDRVEFRVGEAEKTGLDDGVAGLVTVAQARE